MHEYRIRSYYKEEEFLDEFSEMGYEASRHLNGDWEPNSSCSDTSRHNRDYFYKSGELSRLTFFDADVFHTGRFFSSVVIHLKSSTRIVSVRIRSIDDRLIATTEFDRPTT
jgi:hypothetical protein